MDDNFKLRSGKYVGKSVAWLKENDMNYLEWMVGNRPEMLKDSSPKKATKVEFRDSPPTAMVLNTNFDNEGPAPNSIPYLKKMEEDNKKDK